MLAQLPFALDLAQWQTWLIPGAGLVFAGGTLLAGRAWLRSSRQAAPEENKGELASDPFVAGSASERRRAVRRGGREVAVLISDEEALAPPLEGTILDRSLSGLRLAVDEAVPPDSVLSVKTRDAPQTTPWVQVRVRRCCHGPGCYELGCEFVRTPSWNIMLLFG